MMHPVGPLAPATYWRRRLALLIAVVVILFIFSKVVSAFGSSSNAAAVAPRTSTVSTSAAPSPPTTTAPLKVTLPRAAAPSSSRPPATPAPTSSAPSTSPADSSGTSSGASAAPAVTAPACTSAQVHVNAVSGQTSYAVGDQPMLGLQATNTAGADCTVTLSDNSVVLQVYNGESRVWASNDCPAKITPVQQVLPSGVAVTVNVPWAGTTSTPGCQGTRQPVSAGTYTLYATFGGRHGTATQFAFH